MQPCPFQLPTLRSTLGLLITAVILLAACGQIDPFRLALQYQLLPALFAICLAAFVCADHSCQRAADALVAADVTDIQARCDVRRSSRMVYLWLYVLVGVNTLVAWWNHIPFEAAAARLNSFPIAGVAVLILIRVAAVARRLRQEVGMMDLDKALAEVQLIRGQLARGMEFRGYGPATIAATALLAFLASAAQLHWLIDPARSVTAWLAIWVATAVLSVTVIGIETILRSRRIHSDFAMEMLHSALEQFLPSIVAGLLLTVVLWRYSPDEVWMLPGLWQLIFSIGVFASRQFLPRPIFVVGVWYLATGLTCLALGRSLSLSPWAMSVPFGFGQLLVASVLQFGYRSEDAR